MIALLKHTFPWVFITCVDFLFCLPEDQMLKEGYPAYTTSCAWLGYSDEQLKQVSVL